MAEIPNKVLIADRNPLLRRGVGSILHQNPNFQVIGETDNAKQVIEFSFTNNIHILISGLDLLEQPIQEVLRAVRKNIPSLKIILLAEPTEELRVSRLIPLGLDGCLFMGETTENLLKALDSVACGGVWFSQSLIKSLINPQGNIGQKLSIELTIREHEVLQLISKGESNLQIANILGLSIQTVKKLHKSPLWKIRCSV